MDDRPVGSSTFPPPTGGQAFYVSGRLLGAVTAFRSRDMSTKLHRWTLILMVFDMALSCRVDLSHHLADALSCFHTPGQTAAEVNTSFLTEVISTEHGDSLGSTGPIFDGVLLSDLEAQPVSGPRTISLANFVDRANHPVSFDSVPPTFV